MSIRYQPSIEGSPLRPVATMTVPFPGMGTPVQRVSREAGRIVARGVARNGPANSVIDGLPWPMRGSTQSPNPMANLYAYGANFGVTTTRIVR